MALDATVGGTSADSYLTVAAADSLAAADIGSAADSWGNADAIRKEKSLKRATRDVESYLQSAGATPYSSTQALLYPRAVDVTSGTPYIPSAIQRATWAQAKFLIAGGANVVDAADLRAARQMLSASEPNISYSQDETPTSPFLCSEARAHLQGAFGGAATIKSVAVGTWYGLTWPLETSELIP